MEGVTVCYHIQLIDLRLKYLVTQAKLFLGCTTTWEQPMVQKAASYIEINAVVTACVNFFKNVCGSASPSIHACVTRLFLHELCLGMRLPQWLTSHTLLCNVNRGGVGIFSMVRGPIFGRLQYNRSLWTATWEGASDQHTHPVSNHL